MRKVLRRKALRRLEVLDALRTLVCLNIHTVQGLCREARTTLERLEQSLTARSRPQFSAELSILRGRRESLRAEARAWNDAAIILRDKRRGDDLPLQRWLAADAKLSLLTHWIEHNASAAKQVCAPLWQKYKDAQRKRLLSADSAVR